MGEVKWIKIVTDIFDDEKIKFIETLINGDSIIVIWFKLLCLAGKSNNNGFLMFTNKIPYTEEMLTSIFGRSLELIRNSLETFVNLDMIEIIDNKIYLSNWEKHQNAEKLEKIREQGRIRTERCRERRAECNAKCVIEALPERYTDVTVTQQNKNIDKDIKERNIKKESPIENLISDYTDNAELAQALSDFIEMRKTIKQPLTERALKNILSSLDKHSGPYKAKDRYKVQCLEQSITNNWRGVFPLKEFEDDTITEIQTERPVIDENTRLEDLV